jgi:hypothetical protein
MTFISEKNADILPEHVEYSPVRGDVVDEKFGMLLEKYNIKIPVRRMFENGYLFGTK